MEEIVDRCDFVDHVVTSTLKLKNDSFKRVVRTFPHIEKQYRKLYSRENRTGSYYYLPEKIRREILFKVEEACSERGISCAFCREGFEFKAESCDGQHLLRKYK